MLSIQNESMWLSRDEKSEITLCVHPSWDNVTYLSLLLSLSLLLNWKRSMTFPIIWATLLPKVDMANVKFSKYSFNWNGKYSSCLRNPLFSDILLAPIFQLYLLNYILDGVGELDLIAIMVLRYWFTETDFLAIFLFNNSYFNAFAYTVVI